MLTFAGGLSALAFSGEPQAEAPPLPFDLLSEGEKARAIALVMADPSIQDLLEGERHRVIGASLKLDKVRSLEGERLVDVHVYRYGSDDVVWAVAELRAGVLDEVRVERFQPSLTRAEIDETTLALLADPAVLDRVGDSSGVAARMILVSAEEGPCAVHRCVEAQLLRGVEPLPAMAVYDLSERRTVRVWDGSPATPTEASG